MKKLSTLAILLLLAPAFSAQEVIFDNDFSTWTDNVPDGWRGDRTNLSADEEQVSEDVVFGDLAVRLANPDGSHQRYTTEPMEVVDGQAYTITFWVRGNGDVRTGLFDDRSTGFGFAYNPYVSVNSANWQEYTQVMLAANSTDIAEFILSMRNTVADDGHLEFDRVLITSEEGVEPEVVPIYDIQFTTDPGGDSPLLGQTVITGGIVTATTSNGFWMQNGGGPWSGIFVFTTQNTPARGDSVAFTGSVTEFFGMTQLENVNDFAVVSSDNPEVVTTVTAAEANTEAYEAVLIEVMSATCTNTDIGNNQWLVNDGVDLSVENLLFAFNPMLNAMYDLTGPTRYSFSTFRILPRDADDISVVSSVAEEFLNGVRVFPNPATDMLWFQLGDLPTGRVEYEVTDLSGRNVGSGVLLQENGTIALDGMSSGIYLLTLRLDDVRHSMRFTVQR